MENLVGYAKRDLMIPATDDARRPAGGERRRCGVVRGGQRRRAFARSARSRPNGSSQERPLLAALPSLRLEIGPKPISRKVDKLSCVRFGSARYSVPNRLIGTIVLISVLDGRVQVLRAFTGEIVAEHALGRTGRDAASSTSTTAARARTSRAARHEHAQRSSNSSSPSARSPSSSSSEPRRPG